MKEFLDWLALVIFLSVIIGLVIWQIIMAYKDPALIKPLIITSLIVFSTVWAINRIKDW